MNGTRVKCINDSQRPVQIPEHLWIKFNHNYTVDKLYRILNPKQYGSLGVSLVEIKLTPECYPYEFFGANRFKPLDSDEELLDILERDMIKEEVCVEIVK